MPSRDRAEPLHQPCRVVIAPDSFSGTMTAVEAAEAIAAGWRRVRPADVLEQHPMSDGGHGLVDVISHARADSARHEVVVADARGLATTAAWLALPEGTAVVETAQAVGLHDLPHDQRDPLRATSYGVGQLLQAVRRTEGIQRIVIGLGGSATVDGGAGMVSALTGHALRRADGNAVKIGGRWVAEVVEVRQPIAVDLPPVVLASDVTNPLLGPLGAAAVFGPQKGATPAAVEELEAAIARYADVLERALPGGPWRDLPGAGAAGGLGFSLMALLGARTQSGAEVVAPLVGLDAAGADLVITGEGSLDRQTGGGKAPDVVARIARAGGAQVAAIAGRISDRADEGFDVVEELGPAGLSDPIGSLADAAARLAERFTARAGGLPG